jgi:hypothetical protein
VFQLSSPPIQCLPTRRHHDAWPLNDTISCVERAVACAWAASLHVGHAVPAASAPRVPATCECRSGKYALSTAKYDVESVGPQAMQHQYLRRHARGQLTIENTVSIPFGAVSEVLDSHYENADASYQIRRTCGNTLASTELRSREWKQCR